MLHVYSPSAKPIVGSLMIDNEEMEKHVVVHPVNDGLLFDDGNMTVSARHNCHLREMEEPYHSFSYKLSVEGKIIVYSGDVKSIEELSGWTDCDLMLMETGHHNPLDVCRYLEEQSGNPKHLVFLHHV